MYDFSTLSPVDFEHLVRDLLGLEHGWQLKAFGAGADGGVDLCCGVGKNKVVVQCKHYAGSTFPQLKRSLLAEKPKMVAEKPGRYLVATSRELAKTQHDALSEALSPPLGSSDDLLHRSDLNALLARWPEVEQRHFKLWLASTEVLGRIVQSGIWARSEAMLEDIQSRVRLYVAHAGYDRARAILDTHRVVVIAGSPGVGKSMLAEMLLLTHFREAWQVVQVGADIEEAWAAWRPQGKQIFLYDDFLGQTNAGEALAKNEDARIAKFTHLVSTRVDKRFVLTTRTQVLRQAQDVREPLRRAAVDLNTCVVALGDYSRLNRARIVYNHLYFSDLPRRVVRDYAARGDFSAVIDHPNFSPRIVEQVLLRPHTEMDGLAGELQQALDRPVDLWGPSFEHGLSDLARELLLTLVSFPPAGAGRRTLLAACAISGGSLPTTQALKALEGTWIRMAGAGSDLQVSFADPSCRDYVLAYLDGSPDEAVRLLLHAATLDQALLLLRYAVSDIPGQRSRPTYPGVRSAVAAAGTDVLAHLDLLYTRMLEQVRHYGTAEAALETALSALDLLGPDAPQWLERQVVGLEHLRPGVTFHNVSAVADLLLRFAGPRHGAARELPGRARLARAVRWLTAGVAAEATTEEEFADVLRIVEDPIVGPLAHVDTASTLAEQVLEFVRRDLNGLTEQYEDPSDMRTRVAELHALAAVHGVSSEAAGDLAEAEETISGYESYKPDQDDLSPTDAGRAFASERQGSERRSPAAVRAAEDRQISTLFRNLS
ncbi:MAG: restriction endonuclease [Actinobacteria bacterium]|nr:restriction endonuclease [Actinomycetota bacterium]MCA1721323.1 restriction endonuclease [Actinomycetota bacterium]